jgi:hypothetical protein
MDKILKSNQIFFTVAIIVSMLFAVLSVGAANAINAIPKECPTSDQKGAPNTNPASSNAASTTGVQDTLGAQSDALSAGTTAISTGAPKEKNDNVKCVKNPFDYQAAVLFGSFLVSLLLICLPRAVRIINAATFAFIDSLDAEATSSNKTFKEKIAPHFGSALADNIEIYEKFCRIEYMLEVKRHQVSWIMLAISGLITITASMALALLITDRPGQHQSDHAMVTAVATALPALVTGILVKIWLETGANVSHARTRREHLYRQRIRLLLLLGNSDSSQPLDLPKLVESSSLILSYLRIGGEMSNAQEEHSDSAAKNPPAPPTPPT